MPTFIARAVNYKLDRLLNAVKEKKVSGSICILIWIFPVLKKEYVFIETEGNSYEL